MTFGDFYLVLALGFLSSVHCLQMCGPIVLTYSVSLNADSHPRPLIWSHLAYNAGRTLTYMMLGAIAGFAGGTLGFLGRLAGVQNTAMIIAGVAMILAGLALFGLGPGRKLFSGFALPARFLKPVGVLISSKSIPSKFALGLLLGLLPCGLVYAALLKAVGTGTPVAGALTLLAFGLGTSVALLTVGMFSSVATRKLARWGTSVASVTVIMLGTLLVVRGAMPHHVQGGNTDHEQHMHHHE